MNTLKIVINQSLMASMLVGVLGYGSLAIAEEPSFSLELPAGFACSSFDLLLEGWGGNRNLKEFTDENGNVVRSLETGTGSALKFTNLVTGKTISTKSNGAVSQKRYNLDGSYTDTATGHNVLILFPGDIPAGPSTTLIKGRLVYTVDTDQIFIVQSINGNTTDLCAALSK